MGSRNGRSPRRPAISKTTTPSGCFPPVQSLSIRQHSSESVESVVTMDLVWVTAPGIPRTCASLARPPYQAADLAYCLIRGPGAQDHRLLSTACVDSRSSTVLKRLRWSWGERQAHAQTSRPSSCTSHNPTSRTEKANGHQLLCPVGSGRPTVCIFAVSSSVSSRCY